MANIFDRLQFVKHEEVFATREAAVDYVLNIQTFERPALLAEPLILLYESGNAIKGPNVILAIGSVGDGETSSNANRTFFIDTQKTEEEIEELREIIEAAIKSLTIIPLESDTIKMSADKTEEGTFLSGDVKIADYRILSGKVNENIIQTEGTKGIYAFVDMDYDPETFVITFNVNGVTKEFQLPPDQHVERGWYDPKEESIFLKLADDSQVKISVTKLIEEWTVLPDSDTPVLLFKEHVSAITEGHEGVYDWQDILTADVRVADHIGDNIIHKDRTGRFLYVKGTADNIKYKEGVTVKDALDNIDCKVSTSTGNLIYKRPDGIYATAMLDYNTAENKLKYTYSEGNTGELKTVEFKLNSVKILEDITYDPVHEMIVIRYIDAQGEYQRVEIPVKDIIEEWDVNNEAHNIQLVKYRSQGQGKDILSADAKIHNGDNNILEDLNHELYVNGISNNIKYDVTGDTTVKNVLDTLSASTEDLNDKIDQEISDRTAAVERIDNTIGSGFTSDPHDNVTYKFESLSAKVDSEAEKLQNETERSIAKDEEHDSILVSIDAEIGDGFGPRNTVRDEINNLQGEIDELSASTEGKLKDIVNEDHTIGIDKTNPVVPIVKVNLSEAEEEPGANIIRIEQDGIYAGVDLNYYFDSGTSKNVLVFKTTNGTKTFDLKTNSVVDKIYYDPTREAIIIEYTVNGHRMPDVVVPVGDLINEWRVEDGHPHAVALEKTRESGATQDVLKASVVITDSHDDNILVMDNGALYVSGTQISANTANIESLNNSVTTISGDVSNIQNSLSLETERRISGDSMLEGYITRVDNSLISGITKLELADENIRQALSDETLRAIEADGRLGERISDEKADRISGDSALQSRISIVEHDLEREISRSTSEDERLSNLLSAETAAREAEDSALYDAINAATLTFDDTTSIDFNIPSEENNVVKATVKLQEGDNIIKCGQGLYASVHLSYDSGTNKIKLVTSNGADEEIQLVGASLLEDLHYDPVNKMLVITYKDATGEEHVVQFGVSELFNEWSIGDQSEGTALQLTKTPAAEQGGEDKLTGRVLLTNLPDNAVQIVNNGLYVSNSGDTIAVCSDAKANKIYEILYGEGRTMPECGEGAHYQPYAGSCIISAATSFNEADQLLNDAFCRFIDDWEVYGFDTPSTHTDWKKIGQNRHMLVDVRLSHGNHSNMTDDELIISDNDGDFVDPTTTEFSDTNVVRIVNITEGPDGVELPADNPYNGIYVSNNWDCGMYYSATEDAAAIAAAQEAGYNTNYSTDESSSSSNYNYMNNVRQDDNLG